MSNINIRGVVQNIRTRTNVYTPLIEVVVNAIQAIEGNNRKDGLVSISVERTDQLELDEPLPAVCSFKVTDNGIGFNKVNRDSFDTLYSEQKVGEGGKGFGRFTCLKYFENVTVTSVFKEDSVFKERTFSMGKEKDIIVDEKVASTDKNETGSMVHLIDFKGNKFPDKSLTTIARNLVEKLLPYFITDGYICPKIVISENDGSESIVLNDYLEDDLNRTISEMNVDNGTFQLRKDSKEQKFIARVFKIYSPKSQKSKISLVAHKREVTETAIHNYIPEFIEEFCDNEDASKQGRPLNYIIKTYVFSDYLDQNVTLTRDGFNFINRDDVLEEISQSDIEGEAAKIAKKAVGNDITTRQERKRKQISDYVDDEAPWHRELLAKLDLSSMPYNPSPEDIEIRLQREKFQQEQTIKREVKALLDDGDAEMMKENVGKIVSRISDTSKNDLVHYVTLRRKVLELFKKNLELDPDGKYASEGAVHDIIFPRRADSLEVQFNEHNLWIIDERLNFTSYISSDKPLNDGKSERGDLVVYGRRVIFRGDNEPSNPITIFEFKKPQRDDFVDPSSEEDPVQQIIRYVNNIREGKYKTPEGRKILVSDNTPFFGIVVCDLTAKVEKWLEKEKNFKPMPDRLGWFQWYENINLYAEVLSWDKVLKDADMRNRIFFHKLGLN